MQLVKNSIKHADFILPKVFTIFLLVVTIYGYNSRMMQVRAQDANSQVHMEVQILSLIFLSAAVIMACVFIRDFLVYSEWNDKQEITSRHVSYNLLTLSFMCLSFVFYAGYRIVRVDQTVEYHAFGLDWSSGFVLAAVLFELVFLTLTLRFPKGYV